MVGLLLKACTRARRPFLTPLLCPLLLALAAADGAETAPISNDKGPIGDRLRQWAAEGTAAGNVGDWYDNRDDGHSRLDLSPFPQIQPVVYSEEDKKAHRHWALQLQTLPHVTFGNSSTSASPTEGGSNGRQAYCSGEGLAKLCRQYRGNNVYLYPEHRDYDPATDSDGGYGDLFPANTPYVILSRGSSGSDQPFMRAVAFTLAAFRPEVKQRLVEKGLLMPVVQMILRQTCVPAGRPEDYLTGRAHPTVFSGERVDALRMVEAAHAITADRIPPLVRLKLVGIDSARSGVDYFDPAPSELIGVTEGAIAHVFRATAAARRLVVSAEGSFDVNERPLRFSWVVLRGRPEDVRITPLNAAQSRAEVVFSWHGRAPIAPGDPLESTRVDVGVFAHNGACYSPPAFVTSLTLPNEGRTYAAGRLLEVGYGMGVSHVAVRQWPAFLEALAAQVPAPAAALFLDGLAPEQRAAMPALASDCKSAAAFADEAERKAGEAERIGKKATEEAKKARDAATDAARKRDNVLARQAPGNGGPWRELVGRRLRALAEDPRLFVDHAAAFAPLPAAAAEQRRLLIAFGVARSTRAPLFELLPLRDAGAAPAERLSAWQRAQLGRFHGELLAAALPGVAHEYRPYLTDFRLACLKTWRDVYRYTAEGRRIGWTRYTESGAQDFTAEGLAVLQCDRLGRCTSAAQVSYQYGPADSSRSTPWAWPPMRFALAPETATYTYASETDFIGRCTGASGWEPWTNGDGGGLLRRRTKR